MPNIGREIIVSLERRDCEVNGEPGYFHTWEQYTEPAETPGKSHSRVNGIVEFSYGVRRVDPNDIVFRDEVNSELKAWVEWRKQNEN